MPKARSLAKFALHPEMIALETEAHQSYAQLQVKKNQLRAKLEARETTKKIHLGALLLHHMRKNPKDPLTRKCISLLDAYTPDRKRALYAEFGLQDEPITLREQFKGA